MSATRRVPKPHTLHRIWDARLARRWPIGVPAVQDTATAPWLRYRLEVMRQAQHGQCPVSDECLTALHSSIQLHSTVPSAYEWDTGSKQWLSLSPTEVDQLLQLRDADSVMLANQASCDSSSSPHPEEPRTPPSHAPTTAPPARSPPLAERNPRTPTRASVVTTMSDAKSREVQREQEEERNDDDEVDGAEDDDDDAGGGERRSLIAIERPSSGADPTAPSSSSSSSPIDERKDMSDSRSSSSSGTTASSSGSVTTNLSLILFVGACVAAAIVCACAERTRFKGAGDGANAGARHGTREDDDDDYVDGG